MWADVQSDLAEAFGNRIYKAVLENHDYGLFLVRAGLKKPFPRDVKFLSNQQKQDLRTAGAMHAQLLVGELAGKEALREQRARVVQLDTGKLYRLWAARYPGSKTGPWWFSEGLMSEAMAVEKGVPQRVLEWLRDRLAVSRDWSDCDRIAVMQPRVDDDLPAVQAWGLPQRIYSYKIDRKTGMWENTAPSLAEYNRNLHTKFQGQKTQTYVPWVPERRVADWW